ncbi:phenylacetate--CoA ligase family protein [Actinomadura fibrosa]|uniref:Phenylacetate--CoA ligase family protein n=1 Tax=Actinomadura fibrosa TaxID=111802 RepID=A0ABW2XS23_9ACTN|nr:AMP-binding protein [Actinomadura fibrosa]
MDHGAWTGLPDYRVGDPAMIDLPAARMRALQGERLAAMVGYVHRHAPFWRRKLDAAGVRPGDVTGVQDIGRLPTCRKDELLADQETDPPFGGYTCTPADRWVRYFTTSGTTGRPLRRVFSQRDWRQVLDWVARRPPLVRPGERVLLTTSADALLGATIITEAVREQGGLVVQTGTRPDRYKVAAIAALRPAMITGAPSFLLHLARVAADAGIDTRACGIRTIYAFGEPGCAVEATGRALRERFGARTLIDGLGMTELPPLGGNCPHSPDQHLSDDLVLTECLRPDRDEPVGPGELGELTYTNLVCDTHPLLRYRSGDLGILSDGEPCACGSVRTRVVGSVQGRVDDMIWYRGANIFPSAVEAVVRALPGLGTEYRLLRSRGPVALTIQVEAARPVDAAARAALAERTGEAIRSAVRESLPVEVLDPGTLPRGDGLRKTRRVIDIEELTDGR